jgi:hypothetical protein
LNQDPTSWLTQPKVQPNPTCRLEVDKSRVPPSFVNGCAMMEMPLLLDFTHSKELWLLNVNKGDLLDGEGSNTSSTFQ